jgi:glycosyltransferase involved in cell wall biosynthesis
MSPSEARIPCILWGAGIDAGRIDDDPAFITDLAPTICELLGIPAPRASVGRSLIAPRPEAPRPIVFVIPARNEARNLPGVLAAVAESNLLPARVVVVDDGSTDGTAEVAHAAGALVVSHPRSRGLGAAYRTGLATARELHPRAVVCLDADGEYDAREAHRLLAPIDADEADYVLGSRFSPRADGMTLSRRVANRAFSLLLSVCAGRWIGDGQTGFRAFSPRAVEIAEIVHDYNYAQVLTLDLLRKGMRIREVPITYRRRVEGRSFVTASYLWRVPLGMLREMVRG